MRTKQLHFGKFFLGHKLNKESEIFKCDYIPTFETHGKIYNYVIGPFLTKRAAVFMKNHGNSNPHCQCVADAEKLAKKFL